MAAAPTVTTLTVMTGGPRWWRREADEALVVARDAKGRAAVVLLGLDTVQREVERQVEAFVDFAGGEGPRLEASWAPLREQAFAATAEYLQVQQYFDLDADLSAHDARTATSEFDRVGGVMGDVATSVRRFGEQAEPRFALLRAAAARHTALLRGLDPVLATAREAIAAAQQQGLRTPEPEAELAAAEADAARARAADPATLTAATQAAEAARAHAERAAELAAALPARKQEVARRITSIRTRLQIATDRTAGLDDVLSELRRGYVAAASADLADVEEEVAAHLHRAERGIFAARTAAAEGHQRWAEAEAGLQTAREACDAAEGCAGRVRGRLADLDAVAADPGPLLDSTRRTLRDAQRYLVDSSPTLDRPLAQRLDRLAARLDAAHDGVRARAPHTRVDHWAYLHELQQVSDGAGAVVEVVRERRRR